MSQKIKVELIKIVIGDRVLELTPQEARDLYGELHALVGPRPVTPISHPWTTDERNGTFAPYRIPEITCDVNAEPFPEKWVLTCDAYSKRPNTLAINVNENGNSVRNVCS